MASLTGEPFVNVDYDFIDVGYPDGTTEVYTYYLGAGDDTGVAQLIVTVVYTDTTKVELSSIGKVYPA